MYKRQKVHLCFTQLKHVFLNWWTNDETFRTSHVFRRQTAADIWVHWYTDADSLLQTLWFIKTSWSATEVRFFIAPGFSWARCDSHWACGRLEWPASHTHKSPEWDLRCSCDVLQCLHLSPCICQCHGARWDTAKIYSDTHLTNKIMSQHHETSTALNNNLN